MKIKLVMVAVIMTFLALILVGCCLFNQPPMALIQASPTEGPAPLTVEFDASRSADPNGEIVKYKWDFGDGTSENGMFATHTYNSAGTFIATLTVRDKCGKRDTDTVKIEATSTNATPVAEFTYSPIDPGVGQTVSFDASDSYDPDGEIISYNWDFGDGGSGTGIAVEHVYQNAGSFAVTLTVEDNVGAIDQRIKQIDILAAVENRAPIADAGPDQAVVVGETVNLDGTASSDPDGDPLSYDWTLISKPAGSEAQLNNPETATPTFVADKAGTYELRLEVSDGELSDTDTTKITATAPTTLYVDAQNGSDETGDGSSGKPYKTITKALEMADSIPGRNTVQVRPGVYNAALGEVFPLAAKDIQLSGNLSDPNAVKIIGKIKLGSDSSIKGCYIYDTIQVVAEGVIEIRKNLIAVTNKSGISVTSANKDAGEVKIVGNTITGGGGSGTGIGITNARALIRNNTVKNAIDGVDIYGGVAIVTNNVLEDNAHGIYIYGDAYAEVEANHILGGGVGVELFEHSGNNPQAKLQSNKITGQTAVSVRVDSSAVLDAGGGPLGSTGGNTISCQPPPYGGSCYNLEDLRIAYSGVIFAMNNTWDDPQPSGVVEGPIDSPPNYKIKNEGNRIHFD